MQNMFLKKASNYHFNKNTSFFKNMCVIYNNYNNKFYNK